MFWKESDNFPVSNMLFFSLSAVPLEFCLLDYYKIALLSELSVTWEAPFQS